MVELPKEFISRMRGKIPDFEGFLSSFNEPTARAIRVNTLKISVEDFKKISPFTLTKVPWEESGFYVSEENLGRTVLHAAGLYYVQEPSAMCAAPKLEARCGRVLDMCSAPGGKGTQLAAAMQGEGVLFLNEIDFSRAKILLSNVERLGVKNAVVTCASPEKIAENFFEYFDKILVDAPCSGEGMFKKEAGATAEWSEAKVLGCAERQRGILENAYAALAADGRLVYSTCTFSPEEDEEQISAFLSRHADMELKESAKLYPHKIRGEGHFFAVLEKRGGARQDKKPFAAKCDKKLLSVYEEWERTNLKVKFKNIVNIGEALYSLPNGTPELNVQTLCAGERLGEVQKGRFVPSHSLAMSLKKEEARGIEVDEKTAVNYLRGITFETEKSDGWYLVLYMGYPLGWCKVSGGTAKNHLPKGLRI